MQSKQITVKPEWSPNERQRALLDKYAMGYSWHRSAQLSDVPARTYNQWLADIPELRPLGNQMRIEAMATVGERHQVLVNKWYDILDRVGDEPGCLAPGAPLVKWAERGLRGSVWPLLIVRGMAAAGIPLDNQRALRLVQDAGGDT